MCGKFATEKEYDEATRAVLAEKNERIATLEEALRLAGQALKLAESVLAVRGKSFTVCDFVRDAIATLPPPQDKTDAARSGERGEQQEAQHG